MFYVFGMLYICVMFFYVVCLLKFDMAENSVALAILYSVAWPILFVGSLFAIPFIVFTKFLREDNKNDT